MSAARRWWNDTAQRDGWASAWRKLAAALWEFARDSTPERLRSRYGDADYDWDHRVNTTSAGVGWRERLLGALHSPYQPTEPGLFHEMMTDLIRHTSLGPEEFVFCDLGSGKGRTLLMAADYPFQRVVGVELLPALNQIAEVNIRSYRSACQKCFALEPVCADATVFPLPEEPLILYLFNPFPEAGLRRMVTNLEQSLSTHPRNVYVLYHNPQLEHVLQDCPRLEQIGGTHQYSMYRGRA